MERKWWGSDGATRNCCPFIKRRWGNLPCCWEKKDETIKKNKGKPSGLFNHLIYFCKKWQNKIMHRIRLPVRADLHVRKLRPVVFQKPLLFMDFDQIGRTGCFLFVFFQFFTPFFTASAPVQCLQLTCTTGRICVRGCTNALIQLSSVHFNLSQLLNALFQRQKNNQAWAKEFNQYLYFYQSNFLCHTSICSFTSGQNVNTLATSGLQSLFKVAMLLSLCTSALPSSSGQLLLTSNKRETVWSQLDDGGNSYNFLHVTVWHKPEAPQGHLQGNSITFVIS